MVYYIAKMLRVTCCYFLPEVITHKKTNLCQSQTMIGQVLLLREQNRKFYQWNTRSITPEEVLIVDFDLEVGDITGQFPTDTIIAIDSILIGNEQRKVFHTYYGRTIYEGIGTNQGLFNGLSSLGDESFAILNCYAQNGENHLLHNGWLPEVITVTPCDDFLTNLEIVGKNPDVQVYPNPTDNFLNIVINKPDFDLLTIEIFSLNGQLLLQKQVSTNQLFEIDISNFSTGFYVLAINGNNLNHFEKIIKH